MKTRLLFLLTLALMAAALTPAAAREEPDAKLLEQRLAILCERLEAERETHHIPGMALVVVQNDKVVLARGFGLRDVETKQPVTTRTPFAIGSTTKAFTAALLQMLADDGKLTLDDPVKQHLPYFEIKDKTANEQVTLRDLLCHRTGLTRMGLLWAANRVGRKEILEQVKEAELYKPFRKRFLYNNVMYMAAGEAAGSAGGSTWDKLLKERLFVPLGMTRANISAAVMQEDPLAAKGYIWNEDTEQHDAKPLRVLDAIGPAGAINADVEDLARWILLLLGGGAFEGKRLLSKDRLEECFTAQQAIGGNISYGLGWMLREWKGLKVVEHGGNIDGFAAQVGLIPSENLGYALLMNVTASPVQQGSLGIVWESMLGDLASKTDGPAANALSADEMRPYLGEYHLPKLGVTATVRIEKKRLGIDIPGQRFFLLKWPDERGRWAFDFPVQITVEFKQPVAGIAPALTLRQAARARLNRTSKAEEKADTAEGEDPPGPDTAWSRAQLAPLLGTYHLPQGHQDWSIQLLKNELAVLLPGQPPHPLHWPDASGRWKIKVQPNQSLAFVRGENGAVTAMDFQRLVVREAKRLTSVPVGAMTIDKLFEQRSASGALEPSSLRWHVEGTVHFVHQGAKGSFEAWLDGPTRHASVMDFGKFGLVKKALVGEQGWIDSDFGPFEEATGMMLEYMKFEHPASLFGDWRKLFKRILVGKKSEIDGEEVYAVRCTPHHGPALTRYVSARTGLVLKDDWYIIAKGVMTFPITVTYSDYRKVGGMPVPFRQESTGVQMGTIVVELTSAEAVEEIPAGVFEPRAPR